MSKRRKYQEDSRAVGVTFVDVLFALVVARVLEPFADVSKIPWTGKVHLFLAGVLAITSWIGYHNSSNRSKYFIYFFNLPFWQFLIDVALVVVYWMTAALAEGLPSTHRPPSARPEAVLVVLSFALYVAWDQVARMCKKYPESEDVPKDVPKDVPERRRRVTKVFLAIATAGTVAIWLYNPHSAAAIVGTDIALILLLLWFRFAKDRITA